MSSLRDELLHSTDVKPFGPGCILAVSSFPNNTNAITISTPPCVKIVVYQFYSIIIRVTVRLHTSCNYYVVPISCATTSYECSNPIDQSHSYRCRNLAKQFHLSNIWPCIVPENYQDLKKLVDLRVEQVPTNSFIEITVNSWWRFCIDFYLT